MGRRLPGQVIARQHHADDAARRVANGGPAAHELASALERLRSVGRCASARDERREMIGGRPDAISRQAGRFDGNERHDVAARAGLRSGAVNLDQPDASWRHFPFDRPPYRVEIARLDRGDRDRSGDSRGVAGDANLPLAVVVLRDPRRRSQHVVDRLAEPLLGAAANQLAADNEHEDARHNREAEQRHHELGAEPRERQAAAAFDHELDDVAREDEDERDEHRQVGGRERVEDDLGQEVRVELGRAVGEPDHRHERRDEDEDAEENEPWVVAKRTAFGTRRRGPCRQRRAGRLARGAHVGW